MRARIVRALSMVAGARSFGLLAMLAGALLFGFGLLGLSGMSLTRGAPFEPGPPNVVFIVTDDMRADDLQYMPETQELLVSEGTTFSNAFVTRSTCCPSRASMLTGRYAHNHQVLGNAPPFGGFERFRDLGHEESTVATWLRDGGYRTVLLGKYLNRYGDEEPEYVPPGWDEWYSKAQGDTLCMEGCEFNENGTLVPYEKGDYFTDIISRRANEYVERAADDPQPFFMYLAPRAPHEPFRPAPRHRDEFSDAEVPQSPSFDEEDVSDKPLWIRTLPRLNPAETEQIDKDYRNRLRSLLSVDEMVSGLIRALQETGELENTYIVFTSDNGFHVGEHRLRPDKSLAYEEDIRVPLVVRGPDVPAGQTLPQAALNTDFAPTFAEWAGITAPATVDGRSLTPLLTDDPAPDGWRSAFLVESWIGEDATEDYKAVRTEGHKYVEHDTTEIELYDLAADPYELENLHGAAGSTALEQQLKARLEDLEGCAGEGCRAAEDGP